MILLAKPQTEQLHFCFRCGHPRDNHRKMYRIATRETIWVDCLRPIGERFRFKMKIVDVCQCAEYKAREKTTEMNRPSE